MLVAHAYTRYMGDLSGGQVLKKVAQRALKLPSTGEGVYFYQFDGIHSAKAFKQLYRSRMNELELDMATKDRLVAEAVLAFQFNMEVRNEGRKEGSPLIINILFALTLTTAYHSSDAVNPKLYHASHTPSCLCVPCRFCLGL